MDSRNLFTNLDVIDVHIDSSAFANFLDKDDELSETAKKVIGGLIKLTPSLTAFGNTNPTSYLRLVPHQEAPRHWAR